MNHFHEVEEWFRNTSMFLKPRNPETIFIHETQAGFSGRGIPEVPGFDRCNSSGNTCAEWKKTAAISTEKGFVRSTLDLCKGHCCQLIRPNEHGVRILLISALSQLLREGRVPPRESTKNMTVDAKSSPRWTQSWYMSPKLIHVTDII